jgi:dTDP-glucose 4,6-dehydratase
MKILVTGGAGFIGSHFVCRALKDGHEVVNIDKLTYAGNLDNLEHWKSHPKHSFYQEDICHRDALIIILTKHRPEVVVHMAAESHVDRSIDCSDEFIRTNVNGTHALLEAVRSYSTDLKSDTFRFLHLSTDEVFGALGPTGQFDETQPYRPNSPYAASKAASDLLVRSYFKTYGIPTLIGNSSNNYGPKQYPEKLIPLTILNALEQKPLPIYGDGQQVRDWLFVEDHVEALFSLLQSGQIGESYCVGSANEMTNLTLVSSLCRILDELRPAHQPYEKLITFVKDRPGHDYRYATNSSKVRVQTGWSAKTSFQEGLRQTVQWYVSQFETLKTNSQARERLGVIG